MKLAMYKGPASDPLHKLSHWFTCLWTRSKYSHCELVFNGSGIMAPKSLCASSSARDGGVRLKYIDLTSGHWDVYELPQFDALDEAEARAWFYAKADRSAGYDWFGLLWFVLPIKAFNNPRRWFCSEAVAAALDLPKPHKLHPRKLLALVARK
jgi:hypothetical protein